MKTPSLRVWAALAAGLMTGGSVFAADAVAAAAAEAAAMAAAIKYPTTAPAKLDTDANGYLKLSFDHLASYVFTPPMFDPGANPNVKPPTGEEQIPAQVKSWHNKKAVVTGYMIPVRMEKGLVTEMLLMRNTTACCYGSVPNLNEWVVVKLKKPVEAVMDVPVSFYGKLTVGAMFDAGYMTSVYQLEAERMTQAEQLPGQ